MSFLYYYTLEKFKITDYLNELTKNESEILNPLVIFFKKSI
jgi:hypothetical protein